MSAVSASLDLFVSTNGLKCLDQEVKRCADLAGFRAFLRTVAVMSSLPNQASVMRLVGAVLKEANDEWQPQHCDLSTEAFASVN